MSSKIPVEKESAKRRKIDEEVGWTSESSEGMIGEGSRSETPCDSPTSLWGTAMDRAMEKIYKHLGECHKETHDLFLEPEKFDEKAGGVTPRDWVAASRALRRLTGKTLEAMREVIDEKEQCERCGGECVEVAILLAAQLERTQLALAEYSDRYREAIRTRGKMATKERAQEEEMQKLVEERVGAEAERDQLRTALANAEKEREELRASNIERKRENEQLGASLAIMEQERDRLRAALDRKEEDSRGGEIPPPLRSTGPEAMELGEEEVSPPLSGEVIIPQALLRALEGWLDAKWEQLVSRWATPSVEGGEGTAPASAGPGSWAQVAGRKAGGGPAPVKPRNPLAGEGGSAAMPAPAPRNGKPMGPSGSAAPAPGPTRAGKKKERKTWPTPLESAVVAINSIPGGTNTGVELMREAQKMLSLEELGVPPPEVKRSKMGGYLLGVRGQGAEAKADRLAEGLRGLPAASGVRVSRPQRTRDIRVSGLNAGVTPEEVAHSVAAAGGCSTEVIRPGAVRCSSFGMGTLWLRCPTTTAVKVAGARGVRVGWIWAPVELLEPRPGRCFRCLELGHLRLQCASSTDRSARCYRCGRAGHAANSCEEAAPRCPLCGDTEGRDSCHVLGGRGCMEAPPRRQTAAKTAARITPTGVT